MSVQRTTAQRPSNKFVAVGSAQFYTDAQILTAFPATTTTKNGSVYTLATRATLTTAVGLLSGSSLSAGASLLDIGADIWVGVSGDESRMIHLRKVQQRAATAANDGQGSTGWVVVEVNADTTTVPTIVPLVARV